MRNKCTNKLTFQMYVVSGEWDENTGRTVGALRFRELVRSASDTCHLLQLYMSDVIRDVKCDKHREE